MPKWQIPLSCVMGFVCCAVIAAEAPNADLIIFGNSNIEMQFEQSSGNLYRLVDKRSKKDIVGPNLSPTGPGPSAVDIWALTVVGPLGELAIASRGTVSAAVSAEDPSLQELTLLWSGVQVIGSPSSAAATVAVLDVRLRIDLQDDAAVAQWWLSFVVTEQTDPSVPVGLWEASLQLPAALADSSDGELFYPTGFGLIYSNPNGGDRWVISNTYPSGSASMQFLAVARKSQASALYVAALDPVGEAKNLDYSSATASQSAASFVRIKTFPENAGVAVAVEQSWAAPFAIAVGAVANVDSSVGRPLWHEAALLYKQWVLRSARWTQDGPLAARANEFPAWYTENSIWINTHWQCHDIFNEVCWFNQLLLCVPCANILHLIQTGGDPNFVLPYVSEVAARLLEPSLNLHWYEWQQGPDSSAEGRYKFDTHYPDYFPARVNFKEAVSGLKLINVSTFPYINGRISDVRADSFSTDDAAQYCTKSTQARVLNSNDPKPLVPYVETYGSGASFCVTNPFTTYWQDKTADIIETLVFDYGVSGVYIDQIASAGPKLCWDAAHDHSLGNGAYWTDGYDGMMTTVADRLKGTSARPMVTEDNAEPYLHMLQGFLTLNAFKHSLAQGTAGSLPGTSHLGAAFPAIYGGYYVGFGAIWSREDFYDHDWWCARVATMLVTGSQLGWFSLTGMQNDTEDSCGPMGVGDLLLSDEYDDLVHFLQLSARSRAAVVSYMLHGYVTRPCVLDPQPPVFVASPNGETLDFDSLVMGAWKDPTSENVLVIFAASTMSEYSGRISISFSNWGFSDFSSLSVWSIDNQGQREVLGVLSGPNAVWDIKVAGRSIAMLEFIAVSAAQDLK